MSKNVDAVMPSTGTEVMPEADIGVEAKGTYNCPICKWGEPHWHPPSVVEAFHADQIRRDGWTSTIVRTPSRRGFYLCAGHTIEWGEGFSDHEDQWRRQLRIDRGEAERGGFPAEVLEFIPNYGFFLLYAPYVGRQRNRKRTYVTPRYWREIPAPPRTS